MADSSNDNASRRDTGREARIRAHAHRLWQQEGSPEGRAADHWEMAKELVAIEDNQLLATKPNPLAKGEDGEPYGEPVEEARFAVENQGDFPGLTDQGEHQGIPHRGDAV